MRAKPVKIDSLLPDQRRVMESMPANCDIGMSLEAEELWVVDGLLAEKLIGWNRLTKAWHLTPVGLRVRNNLRRRAKREAKGGA